MPSPSVPNDAALHLSGRAIAVAFLDSPPRGVRPWSNGPVPAGCAFWRRAMNGETFYTVPQDHYNCAVGSHTHALRLPPERADELRETLNFMVANHYLEISEVPGIPVLTKGPAVVAYGPARAVPFTPDVVIVAATPSAAMLLYEAAVRAGAAKGAVDALGRPGCAVLPLTHSTGLTSLSFGCSGNRTFTGLPAEELYVAIPGPKWGAVLEALDVVHSANLAMQAHYTSKRSQFPIL